MSKKATYEVKIPFSNGLTQHPVGTQLELEKGVAEASVLSGHLIELFEPPAAVEEGAGDASTAGDGKKGKNK